MFPEHHRHLGVFQIKDPPHFFMKTNKQVSRCQETSNDPTTVLTGTSQVLSNHGYKPLINGTHCKLTSKPIRCLPRADSMDPSLCVPPIIDGQLWLTTYTLVGFIAGLMQTSAHRDSPLALSAVLLEEFHHVLGRDKPARIAKTCRCFQEWDE